MRRIQAALVSLLAGLLVFVPGALAQPTNDDFANAIAFDRVPFSTFLDTRDATAAPDDPTLCPTNTSVWYAFTPSRDMTIQADTFGSDYPTVLSAWTGARGSLFLHDCRADSRSSQQSIIHVEAVAGTTYYFMIGGCPSCSSGGNLRFNVNEFNPPPNDNFESATPVTSVPFTDQVDLTTPSIQSGEPSPSCGIDPDGTAWYAFTPSVSQSYRVSLSSDDGLGFVPQFAIYTGSSLDSLTEVGCPEARNGVAFHADAGTTYHIQVANGGGGPGQPVLFTLDVAPPPQVDFSVVPSNPSIFDTVLAHDETFDPVGIGVVIDSQAWSFGDGSTGTGCCPTHRYAADGAYTVTETVRTYDGRTASSSKIVNVVTHDVGIVKFTVPQTASAGQTRQITVGLRNSHYPETVEVQLLKSTAGSCCAFEQVGSLTQLVPVRGGNRTTPFSFDYTFTSDDAIAGKVTFEAVATLFSAVDALPADNGVIALPTKVNR